MGGAVINDFYLTEGYSNLSTKLYTQEWTRQLNYFYVQVEVSSSLNYDIKVSCKEQNTSQEISVDRLNIPSSTAVNTIDIPIDSYLYNGSGLWDITVTTSVGAAVRSDTKTYYIDNEPPGNVNFTIDTSNSVDNAGHTWYKDIKLKTSAEDKYSGLRNAFPIEYKVTPTKGEEFNLSSGANEEKNISEPIAGKTKITATVIDNVDNRTIVSQDKYIDRLGPEVTITKSGMIYNIDTVDTESGIDKIYYEIFDNNDNGTPNYGDDDTIGHDTLQTRQDISNTAQITNIYSSFMYKWIKVTAIDNLGNSTIVTKQIRQDPPKINIKWGDKANTVSAGIGIKADITYDDGADLSKTVAQYIWSNSNTKPSDSDSWLNYTSGNNINIMQVNLASGVNSKDTYLWIRAKNNKDDPTEPYEYASQKFVRQNLLIAVYNNPDDINYISTNVESNKTYYDYNYAITGFLTLTRYTTDYKVRLKYKTSTTEFSTIPASWNYSEILLNPERDMIKLHIPKPNVGNADRENIYIYVQAIDEIGNFVNNSDIRFRIGVPNITRLQLVWDYGIFGSGEPEFKTIDNNKITVTNLIGSIIIKGIEIKLPSTSAQIKFIITNNGTDYTYNKTYNNSNLYDEINLGTFSTYDWGRYYIYSTYKYDPDGSEEIPEKQWVSPTIEYNKN